MKSLSLAKIQAFDRVSSAPRGLLILAMALGAWAVFMALWTVVNTLFSALLALV